jgi:hypothetical protein
LLPKIETGENGRMSFKNVDEYFVFLLIGGLLDKTLRADSCRCRN